MLLRADRQSASREARGSFPASALRGLPTPLKCKGASRLCQDYDHTYDCICCAPPRLASAEQDPGARTPNSRSAAGSMPWPLENRIEDNATLLLAVSNGGCKFEGSRMEHAASLVQWVVSLESPDRSWKPGHKGPRETFRLPTCVAKNVIGFCFLEGLVFEHF
jgi:hypothetical protein